MSERRHPVVVPRWALLLLIAITLFALSPWSPMGPFDARDYSRLPGAHLVYSPAGALIAPLLAPAEIIMGAPDYRIAAASALIWTLGLTLIISLVLLWRRHPRPGLLLIAGGALLRTVLIASTLIAYLLCSVFLHLPGWRLVVDNPNLVVADLQSHTVGSHDGLVTARQSLDWHADHGYNLIAVTEHKHPRGAFIARAVAEGSKSGIRAVIPGVEINTEREEFVLGLGVKSRLKVLQYGEHPEHYARAFIRDIHQRHHGAAVALSWLLTPESVPRLVKDGVDGFEIVNTGHPDVPLAVRRALLKAAQQDGIVLVASTDWHGWSGNTRTWTLVQVPDAENMSPSQKAAAVVRLLRQRDAAAFTPVVAGYLGPTPLWRAIFSPFVEAARYAASLPLAGVLAWWAWGGLLFGGAAVLRRQGMRPGWLYLAAGLGLIGSGLLVRGAELLSIHGVPAAPFTTEYGTMAVQLGFACLVAGGILAWVVWRGRGVPDA